VVAIEGVGERPASGPEGLTAGAEAVLVVRPEELRLDADGAVAGGLAATVVDVAFLGAQRTVRLDSSRLGPLTATASAGSEAPRPGAEVTVNWDDRHSWAVPVEAPA
jgi:ABC-type Fe3+/spermidine/putrescine transport system ATPase subunit